MRKNKPRPNRPVRFGFRRNLQQFSNRRRIFGHPAETRPTPSGRGPSAFGPVLRRQNRRFDDPWPTIDAHGTVWSTKHALTSFDALCAQIIINERNSIELAP
jgi:hypothetical protein